MDETVIRVMRLRSQGYCCAQIMILLLLEDVGGERPDVVQAARSLCFGLGDMEGSCGVLTGGALSLGLMTGRGTEKGAHDERLRSMLEELSAWFRERMGGLHGGIACRDIVGPGAEAPNPAHCGPAIIETYAKVLAILADAGIDLLNDAS